MTARLCPIALVWVLASASHAQVFDRPLVLPPAQVDELDATAAAHLENARRFLAEGQWANAVEAIRRASDTHASRLIKVDIPRARLGFERYVPVNRYCQWRLAALATEAPPALAHYRRFIDPLADAWLREGVKNNDEALLRRVIDEAFASTAAGQALLKLGDLALARGEYSSARAAWQQVSTGAALSNTAAAQLHAAPGAPFADGAGRLGVLLNSDVPPADVLARLVLASICEGSHERARAELALLRVFFPDASGQLGGKTGRYGELLSDLLKQSLDWRPTQISPDWPTFGGDAARGKTAADAPTGALKPLWSYPLPRMSADRDVIGAGRLRIAEDGKALLSYHLVVVGQTVLMRLDDRGRSKVVALDVLTGRRQWQAGSDGRRADVEDDAPNEGTTSDAHAGFPRHFGVARYTSTVNGHKAFVRLGSPVTVPTPHRISRLLRKDQGFLMGFDLESEGKPLEGFPLRPPSNEWTFEGTPICNNGTMYVVMRRIEASRSTVYVAAFDLPTTAGIEISDSENNSAFSQQFKWQTRICSSAGIGGELDEITHLLLTFDSGRLFVNTSAGAVAALDAADGKMLWLVKYPRSAAQADDSGYRGRQLFRDLTPCVASKDLLIVAPQDCDRLFALYSATGQLAWTMLAGAADDAVHLLGVVGDVLVAGGDSLYWIEVNEGRVLCQYPPGRLDGHEQSAPSPRGFGRGVIAGENVWWPTREAIYVFRAQPAASDFGWQPRLLREIPLAAPQFTGGNLVLTEDVLLIAGGDKLVAYRTVEE